jgi:hypothetical protein
LALKAAPAGSTWLTRFTRAESRVRQIQPDDSTAPCGRFWRVRHCSVEVKLSLREGFAGTIRGIPRTQQVVIGVSQFIDLTSYNRVSSQILSQHQRIFARSYDDLMQAVSEGLIDLDLGQVAAEFVQRREIAL